MEIINDGQKAWDNLLNLEKTMNDYFFNESETYKVLSRNPALLSKVMCVGAREAMDYLDKLARKNS